MNIQALTTIGAKSGRPHTTPLTYSVDGDRWIVVAAAAGEPKHPAWFHNVKAHPEAMIELEGDSYGVHAIVAQGTEYERLFQQHVAQFPIVVEYQQKAGRRVPVVILEKIG